MPASPPPQEVIPIDRLSPHPLNPNEMDPDTEATLRAHIARSHRYPPLIVRPLSDGRFQILDGYHRWRICAELGHDAVACVIWEVDSHEADLVVATINRLHGGDNPGKRARLLQQLAEHENLADLARWLPETAEELEEALTFDDFDIDATVAALAAAIERERVERPQLLSFLVPPADIECVEEAIIRATQNLSAGPNRRGRGLVTLARAFLSEVPHEEEHHDGAS